MLRMVKGQAKDAINAKTLNDVVKSIRRRDKQGYGKILIQCHIIPDGQPQRFVWNESTHGFSLSDNGGDAIPTLTVMSPSKTLIRKHMQRLPVGSYALALVHSGHSLKWVSPSNQLSYVIRAGYMKQGILISGDSGFTAFVEKNSSYYQKMLQALMPLQVIQVAHHGGKNWYFYRVLKESRHDNPNAPIFLLLSHKISDRDRPSKEFSTFIEDPDGAGCGAQILFTSKPRKNRVNGFLNMIADQKGRNKNEGTIRLSFDGDTWSVDRHAVEP